MVDSTLSVCVCVKLYNQQLHTPKKDQALFQPQLWSCETGEGGEIREKQRVGCLPAPEPTEITGKLWGWVYTREPSSIKQGYKGKMVPNQHLLRNCSHADTLNTYSVHGWEGTSPMLYLKVTLWSLLSPLLIKHVVSRLYLQSFWGHYY